MDTAARYLAELGLPEKEVAIYIALLELGKATAYKIAQQSGVKRPTVYALLENLRKKGLIIKIPHAKNQVFIAKDPEEFFDSFEDKLHRARKALPELLSRKSDLVHISSHLFEGKEEVVKALEYRRGELANKELLAFYGVPRGNKKIPAIYYTHAQTLQRQNTNVRVFVPDDESLKGFRKRDKDFGQEAIYLPKTQYLPRVSLEISELYSKIYLHSSAKVLVIEGADFSELLRQIFELLWSSKK